MEPLEPVNTDLPIPAIDEDGPMDIPIAELPIGSSPASDPLVPSTPSSSDVPSPPEGTDTSEPVAEFRKKRSFRPFPGVGYRTNAVDAIKMFDVSDNADAVANYIIAVKVVNCWKGVGKTSSIEKY